jgi:hypothetical protein
MLKHIEYLILFSRLLLELKKKIRNMFSTISVNIKCAWQPECQTRSQATIADGYHCDTPPDRPQQIEAERLKHHRGCVEGLEKMKLKSKIKIEKYRK